MEPQKPETPMPERLTLTVREAAARVGVGRNAIYDAIKRKEFPAVFVGGRILVPIVALERFLDEAA